MKYAKGDGYVGQWEKKKKKNLVPLMHAFKKQQNNKPPTPCPRIQSLFCESVTSSVGQRSSYNDITAS